MAARFCTPSSARDRGCAQMHRTTPAAGRSSRPDSGSRGRVSMPRSDFAWAGFSAANGDRALRARVADAAAARRHRLLERRARAVDAGILEAARARRARRRNQLRAGVRSAVGAAAGKSRVFGFRSGPAHRQSLPRAGARDFRCCMRSIASPDGGESLFGDGFAIAEHLRSHRSRCLRAC